MLDDDSTLPNKYPAYFCQNSQWTKFWVVASGAPHRVWQWQNLYIYEYPWQIGPLQIGTFWYLPKARFESWQSWQNWIKFVKLVQSGSCYQSFLTPHPHFDNSQHLSKNKLSKLQPIDFIKIDFDPVSLNWLAPEVDLSHFAPTRPDLLAFDVDTELQTVNHKILAKLQELPFPVVQAHKKIQYLQATTLDLKFDQQRAHSQILANSEVVLANPDNSWQQPSLEQKASSNQISDLVDFYQQNQSLWQGFNERVRRYTRKIFKEYESGKYLIITDKTDQAFEDFYGLHLATSQRQNFPTQSKDYLRQLFWQDFVQIIIIKSRTELQGEIAKNTLFEKRLGLGTVSQVENSNLDSPVEIVESVFLGLVLDGTLTYLLGGNSPGALKNHLQYLLQAKALQVAWQHNCQFYDLGGWEKGSGYGDFKNGYRGRLRTFFGPFDLALKPRKYQLITSIVELGKFWRSKIKTLLK